MGRLNRRWNWMGVVAVLTASVTGTQPEAASAAGNLRLGNLEIHPFFQISQVLDDNVFRVNEDLVDAPDDRILIFSPGVALRLPVGRHRFEAEYRLDVGRHADFDIDDYEDNTAELKADLNFAGEVTANVSNRFVDGHDDRQQNQNLEIDFFTLNRFDAGVQSAGNQLLVGLFYGNEYKSYDDESCLPTTPGCNKFREYTINTFGGRIGARVMPKTNAFTEYSFSKVAHPEASALDSGVHRVYGGVAWQATAKSKGEIKAGFSKKTYDEDGFDDFSGGILAVGIDHQFSHATSIRVGAARDTHEPNLLGQGYYISTRADAQLRQMILSRLGLDLRAGFVRDEYPEDITVQHPVTLAFETGERVDSTWQFGAGLDVILMEWLSLGAQYTFVQRASEFEVFEFTNNLVMLYARAIL